MSPTDPQAPRSGRLLADPPLAGLEDYLAHGGGRGLAEARRIGPEATIAAVAAAGLRGRGGAGFPTGTKWRSIAAGGGERYAVANAAEGEPGTFKDRALLRANPYAVLEGLLIAAVAVGAPRTYVALKASFAPEIEALGRALVEIEAAGWLEGESVTLVTGPEEYLFGEEKALLEVIEGNDPLPRWLPPYLHGLFSTGPQLGWHPSGPGPDPQAAAAAGSQGANPTLVNNAETLAHCAWILANGSEEYRRVGTEASPGTVLCTIVGDVAHPSVVEVPMGTPLAEVLRHCGGPREGRQLKAVFPGVAAAVLGAADLEVPLSFEAMEQIGSGLGAAGFIVYDDSACMVEVVATLSRFLAVESCGQCPPCKLGSMDITGALERIRTGAGGTRDLELVEERLRIVADGNRCYLPVQERLLVSSVLRGFPDDFAAHLEGWCPSTRATIPTPKVVALADGVVTYDARQDRKRPDWTYEPDEPDPATTGAPEG